MTNIRNMEHKTIGEISLHCQLCGEVHTLPKTPELPLHVFILKCNWCIKCEDRADDYYNEWWDESENDGKEPISETPDNQLCMPFIMDELQIPNIQTIKQ